MPVTSTRRIYIAQQFVRFGFGEHVDESAPFYSPTFLTQELTTTSQRVNLFEKVKIPECRENIRIIRIHLGDEQTAAVARGKLAKKRGGGAAAGEDAA